MAPRVTLAQVAERSGCSPAAVSLVLSGRSENRVSKELADKIKAVAAEMGYAADPRARALRTGRSGFIGLASDQLTVTRYASAIVAGSVDQAQLSDRTVLISEYGVGSLDRKQAVEALLSQRVDALLVGLVESRCIELPDVARSVPTIVVNGVSPGFPGILPQERSAGYRAARHLIDAGHTRIALIGRPGPRNPSVLVSRRFEGIDRAMSQNGLSFVGEQRPPNWEPESGRRAALKLLKEQDVTALLCANDRLAFGAYQAAAELGLMIPADLSVMSFGDEPLASYLSPGLTTMRLPYEEMGRRGAQWASEQANSGKNRSDWADEELLVPMDLVSRGSVGPPRSWPNHTENQSAPSESHRKTTVTGVKSSRLGNER